MINENNYPDNESMKKALITGITGQDGSYLAELLLSKGYGVHLSGIFKNKFQSVVLYIGPRSFEDGECGREIQWNTSLISW